MNQENDHTVSEEAVEVLQDAAAASIVDDIMLGSYDPTKVDPTDAWPDEDRAKIAEIMRSLQPKPEPVHVDLRQHFAAGQIIKDPNNLRLAIRSVGQDAMNVEVLGKKGRFVNGYEVNISGFLFVTTRSKKNKSVFQLYGVQPPANAKGGNDGETQAE